MNKSSELLTNENAQVVGFPSTAKISSVTDVIEEKLPKKAVRAKRKVNLNTWGDWAPASVQAVQAVQLTIDSTEDVPPSNEQLLDNNKLVNQRAADMEANRGLRGTYADKAYNMAGGCISIWAVAVGAQGVVKASTGVAMWSDAVLIAITSGVTVSVLAAFLGVIRGLFPSDGSTGERKNKKSTKKK